MTISAWPFDAVNGAPQYSGRRLRQTTNAPFLAGATAARPLGARSGVRPGTSSATVTATATTWTCGPVAGIIDREAAAEAGPYAFASDAAVTGPMTAANASNARVDIIYVQVSDPAEADGSTAPAVTIGYVAGSPAAAPVAPAPPARSFVLAQINVPKSGGGTPTVTWVAPYTAAAGGIVSVADQTERDAGSWGVGQRVHRRDMRWDERNTSTGWEVGVRAPYLTVYKGGTQNITTDWSLLNAIWGSANGITGGTFANGVFTPIPGMWQFSASFSQPNGVGAGLKSVQITVGTGQTDATLSYSASGVTGTIAKLEQTGLGVSITTPPVPVNGNGVRVFAKSAASGSAGTTLLSDVFFSAVYLGPL